MMVLGAMSYSVYLIHGRLQFLVIQVVRLVFGESAVRDVAVIAITVIACYPFYRFCELPFFRPSVPAQISKSAEAKLAAIVPPFSKAAQLSICAAANAALLAAVPAG